MAHNTISTTGGSLHEKTKNPKNNIWSPQPSEKEGDASLNGNRKRLDPTSQHCVRTHSIVSLLISSKNCIPVLLPNHYSSALSPCDLFTCSQNWNKESRAIIFRHLTVVTSAVKTLTDTDFWLKLYRYLSPTHVILSYPLILHFITPLKCKDYKLLSLLLHFLLFHAPLVQIFFQVPCSQTLNKHPLISSVLKFFDCSSYSLRW